MATTPRVKTRATSRSRPRRTRRAPLGADRSARSGQAKCATRPAILVPDVLGARWSSPDAEAYRARFIHETFGVDTIATALRRTHGCIAAAARALRCSRATVQRYLRVYPALREIAQDEIELALDLCEQSLIHDAVNGDADARRFFLLTRGRARGYVIRKEVVPARDQPLNPAQQQNTLMILDGNKQAYLDGLRQMRETARVGQNARLDTAAVALAAGGNANNRNGPG